MNILLACDERYAIPTNICVTSLFENNRDTDLSVFVLHSPLSQESRNNFKKLADSYSQKIILVPVDDSFFKSVPTLRWSRETYYRLLVHQILPQELDRILWLDCDTVVTQSLGELYDANLGDNYLAMREEEQSVDRRGALGLKEGKYFQAGVILFDLLKTKEILTYDNVIQTINRLGDAMIAVDQDILNVLFDGKIMPIDKRFNNSHVTGFREGDLDEIRRSVVLHYASGKPWNRLYSGACEDLWLYYLQLSPYSFLYPKYRGWMYRLLRTNPVKIMVFWYIPLTASINSFALAVLPKSAYAKARQWYRTHLK